MKKFVVNKTVDVYSAVKMTTSELEAIKIILENKLKANVEVINSVDISILGGIKIVIDGQVIDISLLGKLSQLKNQFTNVLRSN